MSYTLSKPKAAATGGAGEAAPLPWPDIRLYQWTYALCHALRSYLNSDCEDLLETRKSLEVSEIDYYCHPLETGGTEETCGGVTYTALAFNGYYMLFRVTYKSRHVLVIAFRCMMSVSDFNLIVQNVLGIKSFSKIIDSVASLMTTHNPGGLPYYFTGYSMGGLLASLCSIRYDRPAWAFAPFYSRKSQVGPKVYSIGMRSDPIFNNISCICRFDKSQREVLSRNDRIGVRSEMLKPKALAHAIGTLLSHLERMCVEGEPMGQRLRRERNIVREQKNRFEYSDRVVRKAELDRLNVLYDREGASAGRLRRELHNNFRGRIEVINYKHPIKGAYNLHNSKLRGLNEEDDAARDNSGGGGGGGPLQIFYGMPDDVACRR